MSKAAKISSMLLVVVFLIFLFFNPHIPKSIAALYVIWSNFSPENNKGAYLIPDERLALENSSKDSIPEYNTFSVNQINILIPADIDYEEVRPTSNTGGIIFPNKGYIHLNSDNWDFKTELICKSNMSKERNMLAFGEKIFSSTYEFHKYLIELSPSAASVFSNPRENLQLATLLPLKVLLSSIKTNNGYWLESNNFKGIQIGDPNLGDKSIVVHIYPPNDHHYEILMGGLSQQEVNSFLSTLTFDDIKPEKECV